jgi:hypothetical protein
MYLSLQVVSASIALLENNLNPEKQHRGATLLRYVAATPNDVPFVMKKSLYRDMRSISFAVVDTGKPIHVTKVLNHPGVHLWNPARKEAVIAWLFRRTLELYRKNSLELIELSSINKVSLV